MPITKKGKKIMSTMKKEYGAKKGKKVFYASVNKGAIKGAEGRKMHVSITKGKKVNGKK